MLGRERQESPAELCGVRGTLETNKETKELAGGLQRQEQNEIRNTHLGSLGSLGRHREAF